MRRVYLVLLTVVSSLTAFWADAQKISDDVLQRPWRAQWITGPGMPINRFNAASDATLKEYGVFKFRKAIELGDKPASFVVHVSGDNRYKLFVNGSLASQGPARGDLYHWNYETVDIAPYLRRGNNVIAAVVWNDGRWKPEAQISHLTGFILQGNTAPEEVLNTNDTWKTVRDESYQPLSVRVPGYYVAGPGELVDMSMHIKEWNSVQFDDTKWSKARTIANGTPKAAAMNSVGWMLVPSPIPQMEMTTQRMSATRKSDGVQVPAGFPDTKSKVNIPANTRVTLLLDQGYLTNAYPTLVFSGGRNAAISMSYAEALYIHNGENLNGFRPPTLPKGNRNEVDGRVFIGKQDSLISDGSVNQVYTPLWWRTYRYVRLIVNTKAEPLSIEDIYGTFTGYPFELNATFDADNEELDKIFDIGWRTARLCAFETYMDCPYYEQLQYIGDARIQAVVSFYNSGDDRLVRHGLTLMDHSRLAEGITLSRYPTDLKQEIPTFSLWWIAMIHDFYKYRPDTSFVKSLLPGTRQVLSFFESYQQPDGSLKNVPYWVYTDWVQSDGWNFGMAPKGSKGESSVLDLTLLMTYTLASELEYDLGVKEISRIYAAKADQLRATIERKYWDSTSGLYADTETKDVYSQHANTLAILTRLVEGEKATTLARNLLSDTTLAPASIYFKYYLHQALVQAGLGDDYLSWLDKWRENIEMGLTTWAETSDVTRARSDCHAWGSSPNIEFFRTILGIDSDAPGFSRVRITPHLGSIENIAGEMPHPNGKISVKYQVQRGGMQAEVVLPQGVEGTFVWKNKTHTLKAGKNLLKL
jgi:hypothetical protein